MTVYYARRLDSAPPKRQHNRESGLLLDGIVVPATLHAPAFLPGPVPVRPTRSQAQRMAHGWRRMLWASMRRAPTSPLHGDMEHGSVTDGRGAHGYGLIVCRQPVENLEEDLAVLRVWVQELAATNCTPGPVGIGQCAGAHNHGLMLVRGFAVPREVPWVQAYDTHEREWRRQA